MSLYVVNHEKRKICGISQTQGFPKAQNTLWRDIYASDPWEWLFQLGAPWGRLPLSLPMEGWLSKHGTYRKPYPHVKRPSSWPARHLPGRSATNSQSRELPPFFGQGRALCGGSGEPRSPSPALGPDLPERGDTDPPSAPAKPCTLLLNPFLTLTFLFTHSHWECYILF